MMIEECKHGTQSSQSTQETRDSENYYHELVRQLRNDGQNVRSDLQQPDLLQKPDWFDRELFERAKSVYGRHFMGINFAHLSGLLLLVRVDSIFNTLSVTGNSDSVSKLFKRYYQTLVHVKRWYEGDIFDDSDQAYRSLLMVRGMHNKVSSSLNGRKLTHPQDFRAIEDIDLTSDGDSNNNFNGNSKNKNGLSNGSGDKKDSVSSKTVVKIITQQPEEPICSESKPLHISQYDIMLTQFAFLCLIITRAKHVGLIDDFDEKDLESLLHFWRVIGYYLGVTDKFNLCSYDSKEIVPLCNAITDLEYRNSILKNPIDSAPGVMSVNIVRSLKFIPMLTIYGIMRYLYEVLDIKALEYKKRVTRYSRLSYTLIKLVMSCLLAYKPFRAFNNGLTRLSIHLTGKLEGRFSRHLESKYGNDLNP